MWRIGGNDEAVSIDFKPNYKEDGRPEIIFTVNVEGHQGVGPVFSVQGMTKRFPEDHRAAILEICREEFRSARMPKEHLCILERAIARAERA